MKKNMMGGMRSTLGKSDKCLKMLVGKTEGKELQGRHGPTREVNIKKAPKSNGMGGRGLDSSGSE
jgi:hypothetical protein